MRRCAFCLIALYLCAIFAGCDAKDPENLFETTATQETATQDAVTVPPATEPIVSIYETYYQFGNMLKNFPSGNYILKDNKVMFTWVSSRSMMLYEYDVQTGEISFLCKDATCTHNPQDASAKDCPSNKVWGNLEQYHGKLYAKDQDWQIAELKDGQFRKLFDGAVSCFWHADGNLYVETQDNSLLVYENGSNTPRVLLDEYAERWNTVFGQYLYSGAGQGICRVDLLAENPQIEVLKKDCSGITDGQYIYYLAPTESDHLYRCDMDGGNAQLLVDQPVFLGSINFDEEYLYFRMYDLDNMFGEGSCDLYRMRKTGPAQIEKIAEFPESIQSVYTVPGYNLLFVETVVLGEEESDNGVSYLYVTSTDGKNIVPLEIPGA